MKIWLLNIYSLKTEEKFEMIPKCGLDTWVMMVLGK
jgi:hypothetical protein